MRGRCASSFLTLLSLLVLSLDARAENTNDPRTKELRKLNGGLRLKELKPNDIDAILARMSPGASEKAAAEIPVILFDPIYDENLPDLLMTFPDDDSQQPKIVLVHEGKSRQEIHGQKNVWVMALWKKRPGQPSIEVADTMQATVVRKTEFKAGAPEKWNTPETLTVTEVRSGLEDEEGKTIQELSRKAMDGVMGSDWAFARPGFNFRHSVQFTTDKGAIDSVDFRLEPLVYQDESVDRSLIGALLSILNFGESKEPEKVEDLDTRSEALSIGKSTDGRELMFAMAKFPLRENSVNRARAKVGDRREYATFGAYSGSHYGVGVGINMAKDYSIPESDSSTTKSTWVTKPYVYLHWYMARPRLPRLPARHHWYSVSLRATLGTEFTTKFDRWYLGIGAGNLIGRLGLTAGLRAKIGQKWVIGQNLAFGLDYTL
jgi:hypothetical protein